MTARDTLVTTLTHLFAASRRGRMDAHRAEAERLVDEVLKEAAHEAAERIRLHDWDEGCAGVGCCADTPQEAADLIDPEVSS